MEAVHLLIRTALEFRMVTDDAGRCDEIVAERERAGKLVQENIMFHRQLPMALSSLRASLEYKLKCSVQKTFLEVQSGTKAAHLFRRIRAACVDLGVEAGLSDACGLRVPYFAPPWMLADLTLQEEDAADEHVPCCSSDFLLPLCIRSAGTCHILNNMASKVHSALSWWEKFMDGFLSFAYLLHHDHLRQRIVGLLMLGTRWSHMEFAFKRGCPKHAEWRWGTIG